MKKNVQLELSSTDISELDTKGMTKIWENPQRSKQRNSTPFSSTPSRTMVALLP